MMVNIPVIVLTIVVPTFSSSVNIYSPFSHTTESQINIDGNLWYTKFEPSHSNLVKRSTESNSTKDNSSSDIGKYVDLHKDEFCVDVSTYGSTKYDEKSVKVCDSTFVKNCKDKSKEVCDDVTETVCDITPYTECKMLMEYTPYQSFEVFQRQAMKKVCTAGTEIVKHVKLLPACRNVTKQNCITKWETDKNGKQVWAGNEACDPVTWKECKLAPKEVNFKVPHVTCEDGEDVHYDDYIDIQKTQMTTRMVCDVKHTTSCQPKVSNKCKLINFQECNEEPIEKCETKIVKIPKQEKEHKKKCLLTHDNASPKTTTTVPETYPTPGPKAPAPEPSYPIPEPTYPVPKPTTVPTPSYVSTLKPTEEPLHPLHPPSYHATKAEINMYNHYVHAPKNLQGV